MQLHVAPTRKIRLQESGTSEISAASRNAGFVLAVSDLALIIWRSRWRVFCPRRDQSPPEQRQLPARFLRILANDRDGLSRGNVVTRSPVVFARDAAEILLNKLFPPR